MPKKRSGRFAKAATNVESGKEYLLDEACALVKKNGTAKFDETVELAFKLGVDPRKAEQIVRGTVALPHGTGKEVRVLVFTQGDNVAAAEEAGADYVGGEEFAEKIQGGWLDFDAVITSPDMMKIVGKLGKVLGPRGLMPSPKSGTVTPDVADAVKAVKAGKIEYRTDKNANIHVPVGKVSFETQALIENASVVIDAIVKARPSAAKGTYLQSVAMSSTMGPGMKLNKGVLLAVSHD